MCLRGRGQVAVGQGGAGVGHGPGKCVGRLRAGHEFRFFGRRLAVSPLVAWVSPFAASPLPASPRRASSFPRARTSTTPRCPAGVLFPLEAQASAARAGLWHGAPVA